MWEQELSAVGRAMRPSLFGNLLHDSRSGARKAAGRVAICAYGRAATARKLINPENSVAFILGLCALPWACGAAPGPTPGSYRLTPLFAAADAVCWGTFTSIADVDTRTETNGAQVVSKSIRFSAARCYKGDLAAGDQIRYERLIPPVSPGDVSAKAGDSGLVFLKRVNGGTLNLRIRSGGGCVTPPCRCLPRKVHPG